MTGRPPFWNLNDFAVLNLVGLQGRTESRPTELSGNEGDNDGIWNLINKCWTKDTARRSSISMISEELEEIRRFRSSGRRTSHQISKAFQAGRPNNELSVSHISTNQETSNNPYLKDVAELALLIIETVEVRCSAPP